MTERIHRLWPSVAAVGAMLITYFGERVLPSAGPMRIVFAALSAGLLLAAIAMRAKELGAVPEHRKPVVKSLLFGTVGIAVGLALYAMIPLALKGEGSALERIRGVTWVVFLILLAISAARLIALELAVFPVAYIDRYEYRRISRALMRGTALAMLLSVVFLTGYIAKRVQLKADLASAGRIEPSAATKQIFKETTKPVRVILFFPAASDVIEVVDDYFDKLGKLPNIEMIKTDQALDTKLASDMGVGENGYVVVAHEKIAEKIRIGEKLQNAKSALKSFDQNLAKGLIKVTKQQAVAYFTVGHGERRTESVADDVRSGHGTLKQGLSANRYEVKTLGVAEGLAADVPKDAALVFIMGPTKPFLAEEIASLKRALDRGVRLLICLEPEAEGDAMAELLAELGLKFDKTILVNDEGHVKVSYTDADKAFLYSNRYSSHASVTTMTRYSAKLATLFPRTGSLEKIENAPKGTRVDMVIQALDGTYADLDGDLAFDEGKEQRKAYGLAAAVTRTASASESRAFVLADADVFADKYLRFQGQAVLLDDVIYWLRDMKDPILPTVTEEDVRIAHKRDEDALWFYSTTLGVPLLVGAAGLVVVKRRRR
jgi:hypothetical protein